MKLSRSMSRKAFGPIWWAMWAWVGAFLVACLLAPSIERHPGLRDWPKGVTFVILLAVFFAGLWLILVLSRKQSRKRADYDGEARFRQDSGGLRIATNDIEYYLKWRGIAQVLIEPDGLVVSHGNLFFLVPNTAFASLAGVVATVVFFVKTGGYFLEPVIAKLNQGIYGLALAADLTFLLLVPVIYGAVFFAIWLAARAGGAWAYAKFLTGAIHGGVIGAAFGGDGPFRLTGVTRLPPYLVQAREERIEALDLGGIDDAALFSAAQSLYNSVVASEGPDGGIANPDVMWKRLSDALYHNAYMRDEGVILTVADHLCACWSRPRN